MAAPYLQYRKDEQSFTFYSKARFTKTRLKFQLCIWEISQNLHQNTQKILAQSNSLCNMYYYCTRQYMLQNTK